MAVPLAVLPVFSLLKRELHAKLSPPVNNKDVSKTFPGNVFFRFSLDIKRPLCYNEGIPRRRATPASWPSEWRNLLKNTRKGMSCNSKQNSVIRHCSQLIDLKTAAGLLHLHERTLREMVRLGEMSCIRRGPRGHLKFRVSDLVEWIERNASPKRRDARNG